MAEDAGVALSINLTGGVFVNQSAAFSDYHGTGANPAANAALTDAAFVASRFRVVQHRAARMNRPYAHCVRGHRGDARCTWGGPAGTRIMTYEHILFAIEGGIARLTLNRPDRLNSFNDAMHAEVRDALARVKADASVRVLLLTGAGRGFCAGQDLGDRAVAPGDAPVDLGASIERNYKPLVLGLARAAAAGRLRGQRCRGRAPAPTSRSPATSSSRRNRRASSRRSASSVSFPTPAARTSCRGWSATRARWGSRSSATS